MSAHTVADLVAAGPPADGSRVSLTHTSQLVTMAETRGSLPPRRRQDGVVVRDYTRRRLNGAHLLEAGRIRQSMNGQASILPAIVSASLQTLGGRSPNPAQVASLVYSDVIYLLFDRATELLGRVPIVLPWRCPYCGGPPGKIMPENVQLERVLYDPARPPRAVAWLEDPIAYGDRQVTALVLGAATWGAIYQGATIEDLRNAQWETVRSVSSAVVGYVADGVLHEATLPRSVVENDIPAREFDGLTRAVARCSGQMLHAAVLTHTCGSMVAVPFDFGTTM